MPLGARFARWIATGACAWLLVGCAVPNPAVLDGLRQMPEGTLLPPGAVVISRYAQDEEKTIEGWNGAVYGSLAGTQQTQDEVLAFYAVELGRRGWTRQRFGSQATTQTMATAWIKGHVEFNLAFWRMDRQDLPSNVNPDSYHVVFEAVLLAGPPSP